MNKLEWNSKRNSCIFIQENAFEKVVCEVVSILSRPQYVNEESVLRDTSWYRSKSSEVRISLTKRTQLTLKCVYFHQIKHSCKAIDGKCMKAYEMIAHNTGHQ